MRFEGPNVMIFSKNSLIFWIQLDLGIRLVNVNFLSQRLSGITEQKTTDMRATTFITSGAAGCVENLDKFRE